MKTKNGVKNERIEKNGSRGHFSEDGVFCFIFGLIFVLVFLKKWN
jgi:hypothetical protein